MSEKALIFGALATGTAFKLGALSWMRNRKKEQYVFVGTVSALYIYPVKSCRAAQIERAQCTETGLCFDGVTDRHWVVVDKDGSFISQRKEPSMALIETRLIGKQVELSAPGMTSFRLNCNDFGNAKPSACRVWDDHLQAMDCGDKAAAWISKYLDRGQSGCRIMMFIPGLTQRNVQIHKSRYKTYATEEDKASFGDFCSYFLCSEASVAELNTRLEKQVTLMTFRPNIVVKGCPAFAEDEWKEVRIGDNVMLRYIDACPRCTLTTVDPYSGVKDPNQEPLKTLRTFRLGHDKYGNSPLFGTYLGLEQSGGVQVGDPVYAIPW